MVSVNTFLLMTYFAVLLTLAIFGMHRYWMVFLYYRYRHRQPQSHAQGQFKDLPKVTVQLPVYNELYVVERLIDAVCQFDYPKERLEIQVLDDSTDETAYVAKARVAYYRGLGVDVHYLHREARTGYKAGALAAGLEVRER